MSTVVALIRKTLERRERGINYMARNKVGNVAFIA